jgi:hypothetical protein
MEDGCCKMYSIHEASIFLTLVSRPLAYSEQRGGVGAHTGPRCNQRVILNSFAESEQVANSRSSQSAELLRTSGESRRL